MENKKRLIVYLIVILGIVAVFILNNRYDNELEKETNLVQDAFNEERINNQEAVTNLISKYVNSIKTINDYARINKKQEFTMFDLSNIFSIDTKDFRELPYNCNTNSTFIRYDNNYKNYVIIIDCQDFYFNHK